MATAVALNLTTQLAKAKPGDVIKVPAGAYAESVIKGVSFAAPGVTLAFTSDTTVIGLQLNGVTGLNLEGLNAIPCTRSGYCALVMGCTNVKVNNFTAVGVGGTGSNNTQGIFFRNSQGVSLTNFKITKTTVGIQHLDCNNLTIDTGTLTVLYGDGIKGGGSNYVTINNVQGDTFIFDVAGGDHPDAVQFWTVNETVANNDITITNCTFERGNAPGGPQGIFFGNENGLPYDNVTISGNAISGGMYRGISVSCANNVQITDNFVQGYTDMGSGIFVDDIRGIGIIEGNTVSQPVTVDANGSPTKSTGKVKVANSTLIKAAAVGDVSAVAKWAATKYAQTTTPPPVGTGQGTQSNPNPLQAQLDAANAQLDAANAQIAMLEKTIDSQQTALATVQGLLAAQKSAVAKAIGLIA